MLLHSEQDNQTLDRGGELLQWFGHIPPSLLLVGDVARPVADSDGADYPVVVRLGVENPGQPVAGLGNLTLVPDEDDVPDPHIPVGGLPASEGYQAGPHGGQPEVPPVLVALLDVTEPQCELGHVFVELLRVVLGCTGPRALEQQVGCDDTDIRAPLLVVADTQRSLIDLVGGPGQ